jgi:predicted dehydrogenase
MKLCLIGTGNSALNIVKAAKKINDLEIVAVCGSSESHVKIFAKKYGVKNYYTSKNEMYNKQKNIQGTIIASIPSSHFNDIVVSSNFVDFIIVEKPIVITNKEVSEIRKLVSNKDISICVIYQMRYSKFYKKFKKDLINKLEKVNYIHLQMSHYRGKEYFHKLGRWKKHLSSSGGGVLMQQGIHWLNLICSIVGYDIEVIFAKKSFKYGTETEDAISANLMINENIKFDLYNSRISPRVPTNMSVYGEGFFFNVEDYKFRKFSSVKNMCQNLFSIIKRKFPLLIKFSLNSYSGSYKDFLNDVLNKNSNNNKESVFLNDALNDVELINKIYKY